MNTPELSGSPAAYYDPEETDPMPKSDALVAAREALRSECV